MAYRATHDECITTTVLLSLQPREIQAHRNDLEPAGRFSVDGLVSEASVDDYDALVLPGGTVNPGKLRIDKPQARRPPRVLRDGVGGARAGAAGRAIRMTSTVIGPAGMAYAGALSLGTNFGSAIAVLPDSG
jgi:hypothetical protein